ncbi:3 -5 exonuclease [Fusarium longipes]|uniref:3-5 exonuclease n=1 Tax=Fusarium longipes TaxID=694270 RepID=A0A395T2M0_9HYPO|nr:3 -5 exonuclease [Fusarium longipes]
MASAVEKVTEQQSTVTLESKGDVVFIDDVPAVAQLVDLLGECPTGQPSIFIDLEGVNLSRHGTVSITQVYYMPTKCTYLIDVYTLGDKCFSTPGSNGRTLRDILESDNILKVFFDVRNDSDALYGRYRIKLAGIHDLQLMELATRSFSRRCVNGLSKCIDRDASLSAQEKSDWARVKEAGLRLFAPDKGGTYEVFNKRPLPDAIRLYCAQDVQILPRLWVQYNAKMGQIWRERMIAASKARAQSSQSASYNGEGRHMAMAPSGWEAF